MTGGRFGVKSFRSNLRYGANIVNAKRVNGGRKDFLLAAKTASKRDFA
jgi:hypothetical protein